MILVVSKKTLFKRFLAVFCCCLVFGGGYGILGRKSVRAGAEAQPKAYLAIVIDDFGYNGEGTAEMLSLEIPLTAAIMPFSDNSSEDVEAVHKAGKEMIVHMPMESLTGKKSWVGDKGVFRSMTDEEIKASVNEALDVVKYAVGINNHMGSAIMEDKRCLSAVMEVACEKGLIFVDSKTTAKSQAEFACENKDMILISRDVFLDSTDDINVVKDRLREAGKIALRKGTALAIGHVGPEGGKITAQAIKDLAPELEKEGIEFVSVTQLRDILQAGQGGQ